MGARGERSRHSPKTETKSPASGRNEKQTLCLGQYVGAMDGIREYCNCLAPRAYITILTVPSYYSPSLWVLVPSASAERSLPVDSAGSADEKMKDASVSYSRPLIGCFPRSGSWKQGHPYTTLISFDEVPVGQALPIRLCAAPAVYQPALRADGVFASLGRGWPAILLA
jgi:hypothetical protein